MSEPDEYELYAMLDAAQESQTIIIDFQILHTVEEISDIINKAFSNVFLPLIDGTDYYEELKDRIYENYRETGYIDDLNDAAGGEGYFTKKDILQEDIELFIEDYLAEEYGFIQEVTTYQLQNKEYISNLKINFGFLNNISTEVIISQDVFEETLETFTDILKAEIAFKAVFKFHDKNIKEQYQKYYSEIYDLEMDLRKVLTHIFVDEYEDPYDFLKDYELNISKDNQKKREYYIETFENEFFMLCFSDYLKICNNQVKGSISNKHLITYIKDSLNFDEFRQKIFLGIKSEKYVDFLASIKEDLNSIEEMRNAIMHGRSYSKDIEDYKRSTKQLKEKIDIFWKDLPEYLEKRKELERS